MVQFGSMGKELREKEKRYCERLALERGLEKKLHYPWSCFHSARARRDISELDIPGTGHLFSAIMGQSSFG